MPPLAVVPLPPIPGVVGLVAEAISLAVGVGDPVGVSETPGVLDVAAGLTAGVCSALDEDELPEGGDSGAAVHAASPKNNPKPHAVEIPSFQLLLMPRVFQQNCGRDMGKGRMEYKRDKLRTLRT